MGVLKLFPFKKHRLCYYIQACAILKFFKYLFLWYIAVKLCSGAAYSVSRGTITCPIYCKLVLCCRRRNGEKNGEQEREISGM